MRALLLAAGLGTRLRPITDTVPKCLVPIHGKPLLGYWFDLLMPAGVDRVLVNTHYLPDAVRRFTAQSPWRSRIDLVHEDQLLGTGGTILKNRSYFGAESFMVVHADNLSHFDVAAFIDRHVNRPPGIEITMMTFETDDPRSCGIVEEDAGGVVHAFHEKVDDPPGTRANGAVYILAPSMVEFMASLNKDCVDLSTEVLPCFLGRIQTFFNADYHRDIGNLASLALARETYRFDNR